LTSGPHAYSGNLKGALAELKKVVADLNAGRTIDPAYAKSVIDAAQKGIEEWKTTVSKYFTNGTAPLPPEVQQILNSIEAIKTALNAPKDCLAQNIPTTTSPSGRNNIIRLFPIDACTLSAEQKSILEDVSDNLESNLDALANLFDYKRIKLNDNGNCLSISNIISGLRVVPLLNTPNLWFYDLPENCLNTTENNVQANTPSSSINLGTVHLSISTSVKSNGLKLKEPLFAQIDENNPKKVNIMSGDIPVMVFTFEAAAKADKMLAWVGGTAPTDATIDLTGEILSQIFPNTNKTKLSEVATIINKYSDKFEINTPLRMAHFLGQVGHETGEFKGDSFKEGTCYGETGKWNIWFNLTWKEPPFDKVACSDVNVGHRKNPWRVLSDVPKKYRCEAGEVSKEQAGKNLFCYVYRCEGGNGDEASCDGYKYRGHGFLQLTWKKQYNDFDDWLNGQGLGQDFKKVMSDPDEAFDDMEIGCLSGMWYWKKNSGNTKADDAIPDTSNFEKKFEYVSKVINRDAENNENRKTIFTNAYNVLKK